jgi:hypothetical protein
VLYELPDEELPVVLLCLVLVPQLLVLLQQRPVLVVYPLSDVRDQLQVMLQLILTVLQLRTGFSLVSLSLLHAFF